MYLKKGVWKFNININLMFASTALQRSLKFLSVLQLLYRKSSNNFVFDLGNAYTYLHLVCDLK